MNNTKFKRLAINSLLCISALGLSACTEEELQNTKDAIIGELDQNTKDEIIDELESSNDDSTTDDSAT
ncbi:hypothetical protein, partial [Colwellia sp. E2M01]|uniref:hypothetical protein n=1 Tax=Colwellia sp. E2M01 TaxID=2841561 RepID=UPI001C08C7BB